MKTFDLVVIGGGAAGLSAAVASLKNEIKSVLIIEKSEDLGGNLNLFIHTGFGKYYFGEEVTGPELATTLSNDFKAMGGIAKLETKCIEISQDKVITYVNPKEGMKSIKAKAILIATGAREKFLGNILIPIHKQTGVFTLASAHRLVNLQGYLPGKNVVIHGKSRWSLIFARRLVIEGANVKAIIYNGDKELSNWESEIIEGYDIDVISNSIVVDVSGDERIDKVAIKSLKNNKVTEISCDSLVLSVGYERDLDMLRKVGIKLEEGTKIEGYSLPIEGIYISGSIRNGMKGIFTSGEDGYKAGVEIAKFINNFI